MATKTPEFPFLPKSTAHLKPGMIWDICLRDGSFACGRVLHVEGKLRERERFYFWGGLLRWHGLKSPTTEVIAGVPILWQGKFDVRSLSKSDSRIRDILPLESDGLVVPPILTSLLNGEVMIGYNVERPATDGEFRTLPVKNLEENNDTFRETAEAVFLDGKPMACERDDCDNQLLDSLGMKTPADLGRVEAEAAKSWRASRRTRASKNERPSQ